MDKQKVEEQKNKILTLLKEFCEAKLNQEYLEISERLVQKLGRKRDVPFVAGKPEIWAAAVIHALGTINFLFDKSAKPYLSVDEINNFFGTSKSTTGNKSKEIRDLLKIERFDKEFSTKSMQSNNPYDNFVMVDGFIVPVSSLPAGYQEIVRTAQAEGSTISFSSKQ